MSQPLTHDQRRAIFGDACDTTNLITYLTPWGPRVRIHYLIYDHFKLACDQALIRSSWRPNRIDSYNCRSIRNSSNLSLHAWGLAVDLFADPDPSDSLPPPGGVWKPDNTFASDFAQPFIDLGFRWGRYFTRQDWPHIEWPYGHPQHPTTIPTPATQEDDMRLIKDGDGIDKTVYYITGNLMMPLPDLPTYDEFRRLVGADPISITPSVIAKLKAKLDYKEWN